MVANDTGYPAQVITAELGITDPFVTLQLSECHLNGPTDGQLQIVAAPGGVPDWGNPLGSVVIPSAQIPDACIGGVFDNVVFEFPAVELTAGTQYALVLQAVNGTGSIHWRLSSTPADPSDPYPGGNAWTNGMFGPDEYTDLDLQFTVCGTVPDCSVTASYTPNAYQYDNAELDVDVAQVITAEIGVGHPIVMLELAECKANGLTDGQLEIVPAPGGVPDWGNPLGTAGVFASQILDSCVGGVYGAVFFEFPTVELTAGLQYALVLQVPVGVDFISWRESGTPDDPPDPYPGGSAWEYYMGEPSEYTNRDLQFTVCGTTSTTGIGEPGAPVQSALLYAGPNPFNPGTTVSFEVPALGPVRLMVYDIAGRQVRRLIDEQRPAGRYEVAWNGQDDSGRPVASGAYVIVLTASNVHATTRVAILK